MGTHSNPTGGDGAKDQEAVNFLEMKVKDTKPLPYAEAVQLAISAVQNVLFPGLQGHRHRGAE